MSFSAKEDAHRRSTLITYCKRCGSRFDLSELRRPSRVLQIAFSALALLFGEVIGFDDGLYCRVCYKISGFKHGVLFVLALFALLIIGAGAWLLRHMEF
jgi:hypothetical protein